MGQIEVKRSLKGFTGVYRGQIVVKIGQKGSKKLKQWSKLIKMGQIGVKGGLMGSNSGQNWSKGVKWGLKGQKGLK